MLWISSGNTNLSDIRTDYFELSVRLSPVVDQSNCSRVPKLIRTIVIEFSGGTAGGCGPRLPAGLLVINGRNIVQ